VANRKSRDQSAPGEIAKLIANAGDAAPHIPTVDDLEELFVPNVQPHGKYRWPLVKALLETVMRGVPPKWAARRVGIGERMYYRWIQERPDFAAMVEAVEARRMEYLTELVMLAAPDNWAAAMTMLERLHPADFGRKDRIEHQYTGEVKIDVRQILVSQETIDAASNLERALQQGNIIEGEIVPNLPPHEESEDG
jgi:hypothetical protein